MLKDVHQRFIMYQLLSATRYLHKGNVIHRDQKPSNVLLDTDCIVKIADFGLARSLTHLKQAEDAHQPHPLTDYVATRWYRSPEILIGCKEYTEGVDIWSLGISEKLFLNASFCKILLHRLHNGRNAAAQTSFPGKFNLRSGNTNDKLDDTIWYIEVSHKDT